MENTRNGLVRRVIYDMLGLDNIPPHSHGGTWESIKFPPGYEKPPKEAFDVRLKELVDAQPLSKLREERDQRLAKCDYIFVTDYPHASAEVKAAWATYRQALRDLPTTVTPTLNRRGELGGFEWPAAPTS
jgi:hypothetical protein